MAHKSGGVGNQHWLGGNVCHASIHVNLGRAEAERMGKQAHAPEKRRRESGSADFSDDDCSTDEEHRKIIAGDGREEEGQFPKEVVEKFAEADKDGSGRHWSERTCEAFSAQMSGEKR